MIHPTDTPPPPACPEPDERRDLWPWSAARGEDGELQVAGESATSLAERFGTPVYVLDANDLAGRAAVWVAAMDEQFWDGYGMAGAATYYAAKAFLSADVARIVTQAGMGIDTASYGELDLALRAGVDPQVVGLHGNNKSDAALRLAIGAGERGIGRIIIDSPGEVDRVRAIAKEMGRRPRVMVRVTTGVHAGGHDFIATAHEDQKFGLSLATGQAEQVAREIAASPELEFLGLHAHIGSQIFDLDAFDESGSRLVGLAARLAKDGVACRELDLGGGFPIAYSTRDEAAPSQQEVAARLATAVRAALAESGLPAPRISIEPGRSVIGPAVITLYRVGTVKVVPLPGGGQRHYVSVDGGMSDNLRPALYDAQYTATIANRVSDAPKVRARVVGSHCESGDIVVHDVALPADIAPGDLLAVPATGAYGHAMSSNYNLTPRPGTVRVDASGAEWMIRPETHSDLWARDLGLAATADSEEGGRKGE